MNVSSPGVSGARWAAALDRYPPPVAASSRFVREDEPQDAPVADAPVVAPAAGTAARHTAGTSDPTGVSGSRLDAFA